MKENETNIIIETKSNFTIINNDIIRSNKITAEAKEIYNYLKSFDIHYKINQNSISYKLNKSPRAIRRSIAELKKIGLLEIQRKSNKEYIYILNDNFRNIEIDINELLENNQLFMEMKTADIIKIINNQNISKELREKLYNEYQRIIHYDWLND